MITMAYSDDTLSDPCVEEYFTFFSLQVRMIHKFIIYSQTSFIRTARYPLKCVRIVKYADYRIIVNRIQ